MACTECWASAASTDVGRVRQLNEDAFLDRPDLGLWVVADGMGGHASGDVASAALCSALTHLPDAYSLSAAVDFIDDSVAQVNRDLVTLAGAQSAGRVIGSTIVALVARGEHAVFMWAGDSRLYRYRAGNLEQLTSDHSLVEESRGLLNDASLINSNIITRAVGADETVVLELDGALLHAGDRFLLCSDGLNRDLSDVSIGELLSSGAPSEACQALVHNAIKLGGGDNITAVVVDYGTAAHGPTVSLHNDEI